WIRLKAVTLSHWRQRTRLAHGAKGRDPSANPFKELHMGIAAIDQTLATQQEWVRTELEDLALSASVLWKRFSKNTQVKPVSNRPARIPTMPSKGGKPRVGNLDGGDLGLGSGPTTVPGQLTTTTFVMAWSYTKEAELATDSDEKA